MRRISWLKLALLALAVAAGVSVEYWRRAGEFDYSLGYVAFGAVSFISVQWRRLLALDALTAGAWVAVVLFSSAFQWINSPAARRTRLAIGLVNLHVAQFEALFSWFLLSLTTGFPAWIRLPSALSVLLFGPRLLDWRGEVRQIDADGDREFQWPWTWFATGFAASLIGLALLLVTGWPPQRMLLLIVVIAIGSGLRVVAVLLRGRLIAGQLAGRLPNRRVAGIYRAARALVWSGALLIGGVIGYREIASVVVSQRQSTRDLAERALMPSPGPLPPPGDVVSLFIVADAHFHELRGRRNGGDLQIVDSVVPQAVRPVELDLLSGVPILRFAEIYHELRAQRPELKWAHLGDFADIGCRSELERVPRYLARFDGARQLAALASGNHEGRFVGNFSWHPSWRGACTVPGGGPLDKPRSDRALEDAAAPYLDAGSYLLMEGDDLGVLKPSALARVARLGSAGGVEVEGVFFDSSDDLGSSLGLTGLQGAISDQQADRLAAAIAGGSSRLVFFTHHPVGALSQHGQRNLERLARLAGPRLLAVVSAHTHLAACRDLWLAGRHVPNLVVGSTIDPPQEAALLEIAPRTGDVTLRTIQSVRQNDAPACTAKLRALRGTPACAPFFTAADQPPPLIESPAKLFVVEDARAQRLLECIGLPGEHPFANAQLYQQLDDFLARRFDDPEHRTIDRETLACLSWAGSILQGHKNEGWNLGRALDHGFEPGATFGAMEVTVRAGESESCTRRSR